MLIFNYRRCVLVFGVLGASITFAGAETYPVDRQYINDVRIKNRLMDLYLEPSIYDMFEDSNSAVARSEISEPVAEIVSDLTYWSKAQLPNDTDMAVKWNMPGTSGRDWLKWFGDRVHVITAADHTQNAFWSQRFTPENTFPLPHDFIDALKDFRIATPPSNAIAQNLGRALLAKSAFSKRALLYSNTHTNIRVNTARFGLIRIFPSFFFENIFLVEDKNSERYFKVSFISKIFRIGTLIHEARHSDGSGSNLSFIHSICPDGHPYSQTHACDRASNGSYGAQADFYKLFRKQCLAAIDTNKLCTKLELDVLEGLIMNSQDKILYGSGYSKDGAGLPVLEALDETPYKIPDVPDFELEKN